MTDHKRGESVRFLADESCDFAVVRALRARGHDVRAVHEERPAISDDDVIAWAVHEDRIVIAEDKDFGYLVHVSGARSVGVVLLRYPARSRAEMAEQVCDAIRQLEGRLRGAFVVLQPGKIRINPGNASL